MARKSQRLLSRNKRKVALRNKRKAVVAGALRSKRKAVVAAVNLSGMSFSCVTFFCCCVNVNGVFFLALLFLFIALTQIVFWLMQANAVA
jgi:hypothetical protein